MFALPDKVPSARDYRRNEVGIKLMRCREPPLPGLAEADQAGNVKSRRLSGNMKKLEANPRQKVH
jgi:hypothetical protein